jgi:hypothetical protein
MIVPEMAFGLWLSIDATAKSFSFSFAVSAGHFFEPRSAIYPR